MINPTAVRNALDRSEENLRAAFANAGPQTGDPWADFGADLTTRMQAILDAIQVLHLVVNDLAANGGGESLATGVTDGERG